MRLDHAYEPLAAVRAQPRRRDADGARMTGTPVARPYADPRHEPHAVSSEATALPEQLIGVPFN